MIVAGLEPSPKSNKRTIKAEAFIFGGISCAGTQIEFFQPVEADFRIRTGAVSEKVCPQWTQKIIAAHYFLCDPFCCPLNAGPEGPPRSQSSSALELRLTDIVGFT